MKRICSLLLAALLLVGLLPISALADGETMTISNEGVAFIASFEGYRQYAYQDGGKWYIGYGTSCEPGEYPDGVTEEEAEQLLRDHLVDMEAMLNAFLNRYSVELEQHQYDALVSLTYNIGTSWINPAYRLCQYLMGNLPDSTRDDVVNYIGTWCHVGRDVVHGLALRRLQEAYLFLDGNYDNAGAEEYTYIHFDVEADEIEHSTVFYRVNETYDLLPTPTRPGSYFQGWYTAEGVHLTADDIAVAPVTVSAKWGSSPVEDTGVLSTPWDNPYSDLQEGEWYYSYVKNLTRAGMVDGYPDGSFRPAQTITAGEALKLILLTAGYTEQEMIDEHWASGYLDLALEEGYLSAEDVPDLDAPISRRLIAQLSALALELPESDTDSPFTDTDDPYVMALYDAAIVTGSYDDAGNLVYLPEEGIIRSELCALVWRMVQYVPPVEEPEEEEPEEPAEPDPTPEELGYILYGNQKVEILEGVEVCQYDASLFRKEGSIMYYDDDSVDTSIGIDVSNYQGDVDWEAVAADGIEFVFLRVGFRGYTEGTLNMDHRFLQNVEGAAEAGLKVGVYFFSTATSEEEAIQEAEFVLDAIEGYDIDYPVVFDWEANSSSYRNYGLDTQTLTDAAIAFCERVKEEGYTPMIYFNLPTGYLRYDLSQLTDYDFWFAQYPSSDAMYPTMYYNYQVWQYTDSGSVDGIDGRVDMNIAWKRW